MAKIDSMASEDTRYELRFEPLGRSSGTGYAFPCDLEGHVNIDALSDADRLDYLYARVLIGREFAAPDVKPRGDQ